MVLERLVLLWRLENPQGSRFHSGHFAPPPRSSPHGKGSTEQVSILARGHKSQRFTNDHAFWSLLRKQPATLAWPTKNLLSRQAKCDLPTFSLSLVTCRSIAAVLRVKKRLHRPVETLPDPSPPEAGRQGVSCSVLNRDLWQLKRHSDWRKLFFRRTPSNLPEARPRRSLHSQGFLFNVAEMSVEALGKLRAQ